MSMRLRLNLFVYVVPLAALLAWGNGGCRGDISTLPPIHLNPNMDNQTRFDPQEQNNFFRDKRAMRPLVAGTVARGFLRADDHLYRGKTKKDEYASTFPTSIQITEAFVKRGRERYDIFCTPCHGFKGDGQGAVTRYTKAINAANFHDERMINAKIGKLYEAISNGFGTMPSYASQIDIQDRWAIVAYIRALQSTRQPAKEKGEPKR